METKIKYILGETKAVNIEQRRIRFAISSDKVDRHNEIVEPESIEKALAGFRKNPVFLACHLHRSDSAKPTVIGSWDCESFKMVGGRCEMDAIFAKTELAEEYWQLYADGHMKAVSIGFRVLDAKTEKKDGNDIYIITKMELYEISAVAVPANREALAKILKDMDGGESANTYSDILSRFETAINNALKQLETKFNEKLEAIECLLIDKNYPQSGKAAEHLLGDDSEQPAGEVKLNSELIAKAFEKVLKNLN